MSNTPASHQPVKRADAARRQGPHLGGTVFDALNKAGRGITDNVKPVRTNGIVFYALAGIRNITMSRYYEG